ncbi:hypothetical protein PVAG01_10949 [Phlyctema vagabunda]|uniref:Chromo domain-containing protein n=1 Tax=Phlyctema vagabunda TaxID=108571 RepID=A0ABR4P3Q8_9HELO
MQVMIMPPPYQSQLPLPAQPREKRKVSPTQNHASVNNGGRSQLHFDFVLQDHPTYIRGTGPPLAPINIMPPHDKDGIIVDFTAINNVPQYLVGYKDSQLLVGVQPKHIGDWVSQRTLENYEYEQTKLRAEENNTKKRARDLALNNRLKKKAEKLAQPVQSRVRKRKRPLHVQPMGRKIMEEDDIAVSGPTRRNHKSDEPAYISPQATMSKHPTLTTLSKGRGLADIIPTESESSKDSDADNTDETDNALKKQLDAAPSAYHSPRGSLKRKAHRSISSSSDQQLPAKFQKLNNLSSKGVRKRSSFGSSAVTSSSSRKAPQSYNKGVADRASTTPKQTQTIAQRYSMFAPSSSKPGKHIAYPSNKPDSDSDEIQAIGDDCGEDESNEDEWEVKGILGEKFVKKRGKDVLHYLIEWAGDWTNTWEREENVGEAAITKWEDKKKRNKLQQLKDREGYSADELSMENSLDRSEQNDRGNDQNREQQDNQLHTERQICLSEKRKETRILPPGHAAKNQSNGIYPNKSAKSQGRQEAIFVSTDSETEPESDPDKMFVTDGSQSGEGAKVLPGGMPESDTGDDLHDEGLERGSPVL